jgi:hypothetical protein
LIQIFDSFRGQVAVKKAADVGRGNISVRQCSRDIDRQRLVTAKEKYLLPGQQQDIFEMRFYCIIKGRQFLPLGFGKLFVITLQGETQDAVGCKVLPGQFEKTTGVKPVDLKGSGLGKINNNGVVNFVRLG